MAAKSSAQDIVESIFPAAGIDSDADLYFNKTVNTETMSLTEPTVIVFDPPSSGDQANSDTVIRDPSVQITITGAIANENNTHYADAQQKFEQIVEFMYPSFSHTVGTTKYLGSVPGLNGFVENTEDNRPVWVANYTLTRTF